MAKQPTPPKLKAQIEQEEVVGLVQGVMPGSKNEWYVALALEKLNLEFMFQFSIMGGRNIRGGQVIDFVVFNPNAIPVFIQGEYWHNAKKETEDMLKQAAAEQHFKTKPVLLMGEETDTREKAYQAVVEKVK
jgi:hypothetical protein